MSGAKAALTVVAGASYTKVQREQKEKVIQEKKKDTEVNNKRGSVISEFSREAQRNMFYMIARIRRDCLPSFITLTFPKVYSDNPKDWKKSLKNFIQHLGRRFPEVSGIWKLEPQKRGAPHFHLLVWGVSCTELLAVVPWEWFTLVGNGDLQHLQWHQGNCGSGNIPCVQEVVTEKAMYHYVTKYISKSSVEGWKNVGKWWGVFFKERLPFGEEVVFEITDENAIQIMRYMRRFTGHRSCTGRNNQSRQIICDANHWMEKLQTVPMGSYRDWLQRIETIESS